jgi:hypothetical protein
MALFDDFTEQRRATDTEIDTIDAGSIAKNIGVVQIFALRKSGSSHKLGC